MKTIGLLGGMSWESTALYYSWINELVRQRLGGLHSAQSIMLSVDSHDIEVLQRDDRWEEAGEVLSHAALQLESAGAELMVLCTNTMHIVAPQIEAALHIPFLHIADATADAIKKQGIQTIGLLGTRFTMEGDFYAGRLQKKHSLHVLIPPEQDRALVHRIIFEELVVGIIREESQAEFLRIMQDLSQAGAEGVIEGCTEIVTLVQQDHTDIPLFDTTALHAAAAVEVALA